ncbi:Rac GTPase-activating protein 1 [Trichinella pseudospiralis]|uniref:Rac GTPase-activating protein 1 n=1 Tax=Trichinella pseudospiralis TaxID=6337 RepID=A0A0V1KAN7_TRIPS|nr:Rac GTPase-activating protein 1 [Trichinella pseudospiralis]
MIANLLFSRRSTMYHLDVIKMACLNILNQHALSSDSSDHLLQTLHHDLKLLLEFTDNVISTCGTYGDENSALRTLIRHFEADVECYQSKMKEMKAELIEARSQIAALMIKNQALESDKHHLDNQIDAVREILMDSLDTISETNRKKLEFLTDKSRREERESIVSETGIDYDHTDDSLEGTEVKVLKKNNNVDNELVKVNRKRINAADDLNLPLKSAVDVESFLPLKKPKDGHFNKNTPGTEILIPDTVTGAAKQSKKFFFDPLSPKTATLPKPSLNRSFSDSQLSSPNFHEILKFNATPLKAYTPLLKSQPNLAQKVDCTPTVSNLPNKKHAFVQKTVLKQENCDVCNERLKFGKLIFRCQDCKIQCHQDCRIGVQTHCVLNTSCGKQGKGKLSDYIPAKRPFIPHIIIHCVYEIERRGLNSVGLYRIPGTESKVNDLYQKFISSRRAPNLRIVDDIHVLTSCLKKFLHNLKEPLIPLTSRHDFIKAAADEDSIKQICEMHSAICELPMPNRDTLAFLIVHLQRVSEECMHNKMPVANLAKIFVPSILGLASNNMIRSSDELLKLEKVVKVLLNLSTDYWKQFFDSQEIKQITTVRPFSNVTRSIINNTMKQTPARNTTGVTGYSNFDRTRIGGKNTVLPPWR